MMQEYLSRMSRLTVAGLLLVLPVSLADAQKTIVGDVSRTSVGQVGQRQTGAQASPNFVPMGRIKTRIDNRVQSRIRNRIDRNYDPQSDAASLVQAAGDNARTAGRASRR